MSDDVIEVIDIDQDGHRDGAVFGFVDPRNPQRSLRTVLCVEEGKTPAARIAKSKHVGLRHITQSPTVMHPHVWPNGMAVVP